MSRRDADLPLRQMLDQAASKISLFDTKISEMQAKHKVSFEKFKRHVESRRNLNHSMNGTTL
jgi:hypothetical protein